MTKLEHKEKFFRTLAYTCYTMSVLTLLFANVYIFLWPHAKSHPALWSVCAVVFPFFGGFGFWAHCGVWRIERDREKLIASPSSQTAATADSSSSPR